MNQESIYVSYEEAFEKYPHWVQESDGRCRVTVWRNPDGSININSYKDSYKKKLKGEDKKPAKKSKKSSKPAKQKKGYFGMSRWNPLCWIIWIILLPFKILWFILKIVGIGFILEAIFGFGGKKD